MFRRSDCDRCWETVCSCQFNRRKKFRCVKTVSTRDFVLTTRTGEAAASRRTLRVLQDLSRIAGHGIARVAVQAMLFFATRSGKAAAVAAARYRVMHALS